MNQILFSQDVSLLDFVIRVVCLGWTIPFMIFFLIKEMVSIVNKISSKLRGNR